MKPSLTSLLLACMTLAAKSEIITLTSVDVVEGGVLRHTTQSAEVSKDQAIELLSVVPYNPHENVTIWIEKDGERATYYPPGPAPISTPLVIRGPARLTLSSNTQKGATYATFRITPERVDPTQTVIVYPGTNNAAKVTLLCSTNLTDWSAATNGLYSGGVAKFFRIGVEKAEK